MTKSKRLQTAILFIFLLTSVSSLSQVRVSLSMGYGSYAMNDLKEVQESFNQNELVTLQSLTSFPSYYQYEGGIQYEFKNKFITGLMVGYGSTGAHSNYTDYSGSLTSDQLIHYTSITLSLGFITNPDKKWQFSLDLRPALYFNALKLNFNQQIGTDKFEDKYDFNSRNISLQPTVMLSRKLGAFGINANLGYNINVIGGKLALKDNKDAYIVDNSNNAAIADWSGFRIGLGINFTFTSKTAQSE